MAGKIYEQIRINNEVFTASTLASSTSGLYDMSGYDQALIYVTYSQLGSTISTICCSTNIVDLVESSAATTAGTTAAGGKTGITLGANGNSPGAATAITSTMGVVGFTFSEASAASATGSQPADLFRFGYGTKIVTFTYASEATRTNPATAPATAITATAGWFGPTSGVDSTANTGRTALVDSIRAMLSSTRLCCGGPDVWKFTTSSTHTLQCELQNPVENGSIFYTNTVATTRLMGWACKQSVAFNIAADQLTSTLSKRYIGVRMTSVNIPNDVAVTVLRTSGRYMPAPVSARLSS